MEMHIHNGLLKAAHYAPSAHCDERPDAASIDMIVIHGISLPPGKFGTGAVEKFFCSKLDFSEHPSFSDIAELRVSSHLFIDRQGNITQFVPFHQRAWHAGKSFFQGRECCNDFSIGIELEGTDNVPYEKAQYEQLTKVIQALMNAYPDITQDRVVGHSDIAPGRKTDPGPVFDWARLDCVLKK